MKFQQQSSKSMRASGQVISPILPHRCFCGKRFAKQLAPKIAGTHSVEMNPAICTVAFLWVALAGQAAAPNRQTPADKSLTEYFKAETTRLEQRCLKGIDTLENWKSKRETYRAQLFEMLGLLPLPAKTELKP